MKKIIIGVIALGVIGFGYYAISPLFNNIEVDDALPDNLVTDTVVSEETPTAVPDTAQAVDSGFEKLTLDRQTEMLEMIDEMNEEPSIKMTEEIPENMMEEDTIEQVPETKDVLASVMGTTGHPASGKARVLRTTDGKSIVRYEDLKTINGPNLHVYLAKDLEGDDFIDLGPIKGTEGNINYEVPDGVNVADYTYIMHWCVPFGVLFNYAEIN